MNAVSLSLILPGLTFIHDSGHERYASIKKGCAIYHPC